MFRREEIYSLVCAGDRGGVPFRLAGQRPLRKPRSLRLWQRRAVGQSFVWENLSVDLHLPCSFSAGAERAPSWCPRERVAQLVTGAR